MGRSRVEARKVGGRRGPFCVPVFVAAVAIWSVPVISQQLPPGATPRVGPVVPPVETQSSPFVVPRVSDRPLGLEEGPRLIVKGFKLLQVVDRPKAGIRVADVQHQLDAALATQPAQGFTVNQLQELAGKVADYYHKKGLLLAQAFIPEQQITNGIVSVEVLEGKLSAVKVEGNKWYSTKTLLRPFKGLIGDPVEKDSIESALLTVTNYPGISAFGVLGAGHDVGATDLTLRVQSEQRVTVDTSVDNDGTQYAGEYRGQVGLGFNDLLGYADHLRLYGLYEFEPSDSDAHGVYGGFDYDIPLFSPHDFLDFSASRNTYVIGKVTADIEATDPKGNATVGEVAYRHELARSRLGSASVGVAFDVKRATFQQFDVDKFKDDLSSARLFFNWDRIDTRFEGVDQLELSYTHGFNDLLGSIGNYDITSPTPPSREGANGEFNKVTLTLQRLQHITANMSLLIRLQGQQSNDPLLSLEQISLTGPDAVRAYPIADALVDKGGVGTVELIVGAPGFANKPAFAGRSWGQVLQFSVFVDYAAGTLNASKLDPGETNETVGGWGGAVQFNIPGHVFARVDVATQITSVQPTNGRNPQYFFRVGGTF
jgi:hemolysin activation/secretion protein